MVRVYRIPGWNDELLECILRRLFLAYGRIRPLCFLAYGRTCFLASCRIRLVRQRCWRQRAAMACGRVTHTSCTRPSRPMDVPAFTAATIVPSRDAGAWSPLRCFMGVMGSFAS